MRPPRLRTTHQPRRLACGHRVPAGVTVVRKGRAWLCADCQPWLPVKTVDQILEQARIAS